MIEVILFFMAASLLFYILFGGADYGAGILELWPIRKELKYKQEKIVTDAMGPVWEANHIWLILIIVILFVAFPDLFVELMTTFHYPFMAVLLGVILRGTAFTFRHYDAIKEPKSQRIYTLFFSYSSLWTSIWLGIIAGSLTRGQIDLNAQTFFDAYIAPWWGFFPLATGVFVSLIFQFLAANFLIGETDDALMRKLYVRRSRLLNIAVVLTGAVVFLASFLEKTPLYKLFLNSPLSLVFLGVASLALVFQWTYLPKRSRFSRWLAVIQVSSVLLGWYALYHDTPLITLQGARSFQDYAAPQAVLKQLVYALLGGSVLIFPALYFLFKVFKSSEQKNYS